MVGCFDRRSGEGLKDELGRGWLDKRWAVEWAVGCFDRQSGERLKGAKVDRGWLDNRWVGQWVGPTLRVASCAQQNGRPNSIQFNGREMSDQSSIVEFEYDRFRVNSIQEQEERRGRGRGREEGSVAGSDLCPFGH